VLIQLPFCGEANHKATIPQKQEKFCPIMYPFCHDSSPTLENQAFSKSMGARMRQKTPLAGMEIAG
jgi:hypothetical protein